MFADETLKLLNKNQFVRLEAKLPNGVAQILLQIASGLQLAHALSDSNLGATLWLREKLGTTPMVWSWCI